ncbi:hypothetical protein FKP32DRAFT_1591395 [Trametes sanguinea]|nr:hypothetical protein FKP32DRAFT_1591395 [Trametes sanguinea]
MLDADQVRAVGERLGVSHRKPAWYRVAWYVHIYVKDRDVDSWHGNIVSNAK